MEILCFKSLASTQTYLLEGLKRQSLKTPVCIMSEEQTDGIGSRDNSWEGGEGNLFFSFSVNIRDLPSDLPFSSASIYFSFIMRKVIEKYDDSVWLKWPNDLYQNKHKIGGTITKKVDNILICGMGINLQKNANGFKALNLNVEPILLLKEYLSSLDKYPTWKQIFSDYRIEFERSRGYFTHINGERKPLKNAILSEDGSLLIENKRVYSIR